jgi:hypothetical protein
VTDWIVGIVDTAVSGHVTGLTPGTYDIQVEFTVGAQTSGFTPVLSIVVP